MRYPFILIFAVAALVLLPGYSSAYYSSVSVNGNTTNDYFTAELYSDTAILNGSISYKTDTGKIIQEDTYTLISGAYLLISGEGSYSVSYEAHFYDDGTEMQNITTYLFIGSDSVIDAQTVLYPDVQYDVQFNAAFPEMEFTGPITCSLAITVSAILNSSLYSMSGDCAVIEIQDDPVAELVDITTGGDVEGEYTKTTIVESDCPQVIIANNTNSEGGVADSNGNIDIVLDIPEGTPFCIKIWNRENYDVRANIEISNIMIDGVVKNHKYNNQKLGAGFARYFCHYNAYSSEYWSTTNLANVKNNDGWFYSTSGNVIITINGHYDDGEGNLAQNVRLSVVFRDMI